MHDVTGDGVPEVFTVDGNEVLRFDRVSTEPLRYRRHPSPRAAHRPRHLGAGW